jgi:serine/threonine protein kinase
LLREAGCDVVGAAGGADGIARLDEALPDLVVLDVEMAGLDGWQTLEAIRSRSHVPILMLTDRVTQEDNVRRLIAGADDYVAKPVAPAEFGARVEALLRRAGVLLGAPPEIADEPGLPAGAIVGSYRIDELIAQGGMSAIYRATHTALDRVVALKLLSGDTAEDPTTRERFTNEWRIAAGLRHPNILTVHDAGEVDGRLFLAMELIDGGDLADAIEKSGALTPARALPILSQTGSALDAAHAAGLVHRDVKPANVLLSGDHAYLTDFGLSKVLGRNSRLTAPGRTVGTAEYLAPEQIRGEPVDARTDVYALGCMFYEVLTGSSPFQAESDFVLMYAHLENDAPQASERNPDLPRAVDQVVSRAMAKHPDGRYASAGAAVSALKAAFRYE